MDAILDPILVAVFPRWSEAVEIVRKLTARARPSFAVALAESEDQAKSFRESWDDDDGPLLLFRCPKGASAQFGSEVVQEIAGHFPGHPVGVLLGDGPDVRGFREGRRGEWNRAFARQVSRCVRDVQVFEYVPDWEATPPRIR